jgi:hypothetical protein
VLPLGTEPLVLADGTAIDPIDGTVMSDDPVVEVPNTQAIQREIVVARKRISDLPLPTGQMNMVSLIISYTLFGVGDEDIATVLSISPEQVYDIKTSDAYGALQETFLKNIVESDLSNVRGMFVQKSNQAATKMFELMGSESEGMQFAASKDVLDRAGQRPVDVVEHRHKMEGGLIIQYVEKKDDLPTIDAEDF